MSYDPEPEITRYLARLSTAARDLPKGRRHELVGEIEQHIRQALAESPCANHEEMAVLLEHVGDPDEIAAAASDDAEPALGSRVRALAFLRRPRNAIIAALALIVIVLAIAAALLTQTYQPLSFAPAWALPNGSVNTLGEKDSGALVGYTAHGHPYFGFTIENTGPLTVRVLGNSRYGAAIPVLEGWSSRLLMSRYTALPKPIRGPFGIHSHAWKREPLHSFSAIDLAPGQIVMLLWLGVYHDCQFDPSPGTTMPPQSLPVLYSFLWQTTTAQIPLPGGLTLRPAGPKPSAGCSGTPVASGTPGTPADLNNFHG